MKTKLLGIISLITLVLTTVWLVVFLYDIIRAGPVETFEQALANVSRLDVLFYLNYSAVTLLTICATMLMAGLYRYCRPILPGWPVMGVAFVPVYCVLNLFAYLSQITIVPRLLALPQTAEYQAVSNVLLRLLIQQWAGSAVSVFNNLAYAILGIPSIVFGLALWGRGTAMRVAGVLLALNGVACIIGVVGIVLENTLIGMGSVVGGGLFFVALFPLSWALLREKSY